VDGAGEILPLPVFPYRRVRIQGDKGRGGLGYRSLSLSGKRTLVVSSKNLLFTIKSFEFLL
jgi:hypothetical protein